MKRLITVVAVSAAFVLALACSGTGDDGASTSGQPDSAGAAAAPGSPTTAKQVATVAAGQPLTLTEEFLGTKSVVVLTLSNVKAGVRSGNQFVKPGRGQFITADVLAEVREGKVTVNSSMFKLVAADGTAFDAGVASFLDKQDLSGTDLTPGQKTSGTLVFDAAVGAEKGARIAVKSMLADGDAGYWTI